jgi:hypothetical protein
MIPFKSFATTQQPSPNTTSKIVRHTTNNQPQRITSNSLSIHPGSSQTLTITNGNNMSRQTGINAYTHNGPSSLRLTNI